MQLMSSEEIAEFLAAIKRLRDQLDIMQMYAMRAEDIVTICSKDRNDERLDDDEQ